MNKLFVALIIILNSASVYSQGLGKWYIIKRNGVIEYIVNTDSTCSIDLFHNFEPKTPGRFKCEKTDISKRDTVNIGSKTLIIYKSEKDSSLWKASQLIESKKNLYELVSWTAPDTALKLKSELIKIHNKDDNPSLGIYFFAESAIDSLRKLKTMSRMNYLEFMDFIDSYSNVSSAFQISAKNKKIGLAVHFYNSQLIAGILLKKGYNPFFNSMDFNNLLTEYKDDPKIKKLLDNKQK